MTEFQLSGCKTTWLRLGFYIAPFLIFVAIWWPEIEHYYVPTVSVGQQDLERGRSQPEDPVLDELNGFSFGLSPVWDSDARLVKVAEQILSGTVSVPGFPIVKIGLPFDPQDVGHSPAIWQLPLAGFTVPKILLQAFRVTGRSEFLGAAKDMIIGWADYERHAWLPEGFLWNDHAVAARVLVVAEFWRLYRNHPSYQLEVAETIFQFMGRSGEMLAKPSHFTFATNHGVMQNLALWHLCLSFPTLPGASRYRGLALERLRDQMIFYVSGEGVVLEHSADYHRMGLELVSMAFRYMTLLNIAIPDIWRQKYERAQDFFAALRRPDGSMPKLGDTRGSSGDAQELLVTRVDSSSRSAPLSSQKSWVPTHSFSLYPISGYSIWWQSLSEWPTLEGLSQTVVAWSNFPGHGHKHADDMSVLFWAGGKSWWESVGYWPYEDGRRAEATSWGGSNSPHLVTEPAESARDSRLRFNGWSKDATVIDIERRGPDAYQVRRQVIAVNPNVWIVIDSTSHRNKEATTSEWKVASQIKIHEGKFSGAYELRTADSDLSLTAVPFGVSSVKVRRLRGTVRPLAGWTVVGRTPEPTDALVIEQPDPGSWSAMLWTYNRPTVSGIHLVGRPYMQSWKSADEWSLVIPDRNVAINVERQNGELRVSSGRKLPRITKLILAEVTEMTAGRNQILAGYDRIKSKYPPRFRDLMPYRVKVTTFLAGIFLLQEIFFLFYSRMVGYYYTTLRIFNTCGWGVVGSWLVLVYFKT